MFKSYLKIAWRSIWRNKGLSLIHILGLSLGLATCLLIVLFIRHELSYDKFNTNASRIYRVVFNGRMQGGEIHEANVMPAVASTFKRDFPEIEEAVRIRGYGTPRVNYGEKVFRSDRLAFADPAIFRVFTFPFIKGDPNTALQSPNTVVISSTVAQRYFGSDNALGKTLLIGDQREPYLVTAVMEDMPANGHFHFDILASMTGLDEAKLPTWMTSGFFTYLLLPEGTDYKHLESRIQPMVGKYIGPELEKTMGLSYSDFTSKGNRLGFTLQPISEIHLHSNLTAEFEPSGDIQYVYIFGIVAVFMLLIACINFMNLSTAGASRRAKEIGIRKVMGSVRLQLIGQFLLESMMITIIALIFSLALVYLAIPSFNQLAGHNLSRQLASDPSIIGWLVFFGLLTGLLAGSYPAFYLSSFNPIRVVKGKLTTGKKTLGLRSGLVVFQFFISISLIVGTIIVYQQLFFIRNTKLGYNKDQVLVIHEPYWLRDNQAAFRKKLLDDPRVISVTSSGFLPAGPSNINNFLAYPDNQSTVLIKSLQYEVDEHYIPTLGMQMKKGRNFSPLFGADSTAVILNETAAKIYGWEENPEGHTITSVNNESQRIPYHVIGIVKDFHFKSLHEPITPLVMTLGYNGNALIAKVNSADVTGLLASINQYWRSFQPEQPMAYSFLDERFEATYRSEKNIAAILGIFSALTILVACLGLLGLAMFTAEQRTREIGIRKVLGADPAGIVALLSKDYVRLVLIGFAIASPVAWMVMNRWLQDFAYRVTISWWVFALSAVFALLVAIVTVSSQAIRAANANPVKSLKAE
ncbi:MAG: ABC transporter permease [Chitinophagaceae bacterium]